MERYNTGRKSLLSEKESKHWKNLPKTNSLEVFELSHLYWAKLNGFETYNEFVKWMYAEGPWKPSGILYYMDIKYENNGERIS